MSDLLGVSNVINKFNDIGTNAKQIARGGKSTVGNMFDNFLNGRHKREMQEIYNEHDEKMEKINNKHQKQMQKINNKHQERLLIEQNRHEEFIISEQRKILEKILDVSYAAYNKKVELLMAQMNCIESTYQQELRLINENISFLEHEKVKIKDNMELYAEFSHDIRERYKTKDELTYAYNEAHVNLTMAIKCLELEKPLGCNFQQNDKLLKILGDE